MNYSKTKNRQKTLNKVALIKVIIMLLISISFTENIIAQHKIAISDINMLHNTKWEGDLMYVDYSDGKETYLKTKMQLEIRGNKIIMSTQYNNEPEANSKVAIKLKKDGTYLGKEKIIEKTKRENGILKIVTLFEGKDNSKEASIYKTYVFNDSIYAVTKEIQLKGSKERFVRNKYSYTRI